MFSSIKSAVKLVVRPKQFAQGQNLENRLRFHNFFQWLDSKHARQRREILQDLPQDRSVSPIPENLGFVKVEGLDPKLIQEVLQAAKKMLDPTDLEKKFQESTNKHLVAFSPCPDGNPDSPFMKLALDPNMIRMVGNYMGILPVIESIWIWYSPNKENFGRSSQYYHFDAQDVRTVQVLVMIEDVDADTGPFVVLQADASEKLAKTINYKKSGEMKRIDDELVSQYFTDKEIHKAVGKAGDVFAVDSDRCFHYGSRKASKPRYMVVFQYFSPYAFSVPFQWWKGLPFASTPYLEKYPYWKKLVLGARP